MTPAFKRWFGESKVVDADGKPLRLYHWTPKNFSKFKAGGDEPFLSGEAIWLAANPALMNAAHNLSSQVYRNGKPVPEYRQQVMLPELGEGRYVWEGVNVMPLYARIERPLVLVLPYLPSGALTPEERKHATAYAAQLRAEDADLQKQGLPVSPFYLQRDEVKAMKALGFDGIIALDMLGDLAEIVVFSPGQVKSAIGNSGKYSRRSHDILDGVRR